MEKEKAKEILNSLIERSVELQKIRRDSPEFEKWKRDTRVAITNIFGSSTEHIQDFERIILILYSPSYATTGLQHQNAYVECLQNSVAILESMIDEIDQYWPSSTPNTEKATHARPSPTDPTNLEERRYYSIRTGKHPLGSQLDINLMLRLFANLYNDLTEKGYFQEAFGYVCVDLGDVPGEVGLDVNAYFILKLRKDKLWPISENYTHYDESDLFDVIELLYDHISKPLSGMYHEYADCGWHYNSFDKEAGRIHYRSRINELLRDYHEGYELSPDGEILHKAIPGAEALLNSEPLTYDTQNVDSFVREAVTCYKRSRSSLTDKRNAVKMLADVLEFLRPKIKAVLTTADEKDLFNIANNFGIRHHKKEQKTDYDQEVWLDWMFYHYLATINTVIRLIRKRESNT